MKRLTVNLAPADIRKAGSAYDLALGSALFRAGSERWFAYERLRLGAVDSLAWQIVVDRRLRGGASMHVLRMMSGRIDRAAKIDGTGGELNCIEQSL